MGSSKEGESRLHKKERDRRPKGVVYERCSFDEGRGFAIIGSRTVFDRP